MRLQRKLLGVDAVQLGEQQAGVTNRVHADVPSAAVRRATGHVDLEPHEAAVRRHDRETVGSVTIAASARTPRSSSARVPTLSYSSSATAATMISPASAVCAARQAPAHIAAMPPFMSAAPRPYSRPSRSSAVEGSVSHPFDADDVEMTVEHQRASATRRADARHEIRAADGRVLQLGDESPIVKNVAQETRIPARRARRS